MRVEEFCAFVRELKSDKGYLLSCLLGLSPVDVEIYEYLASKPNREGEVMEVAEALGRDRSTIQRGLQRLIAAGVCQRIRVPGRTRGYKYVYKLVPENVVKKKLKAIVEEWRTALLRAIDEVM